MKTITILLTTGLLALTGCGDDDDDSGGSAATTSGEETVMEKKEDAAMEKEGDAMKKEGDAMKAGTAITVGESEFGDMLFDSNKQAIYVFERDSRNKTVCYGECAAAWPPVFSEGAPQAGNGVRASLLGTIKRRDSRTQVTYAGKPLYFYAHEDPGVVLCHNVNLNGGFWWAIGADGRRRPA
jgi:predicted lipoprotein with Yx(FWY)xxD motif